ncbi:hypothetical protein OnM2_c2013o16 [Erysiphe neolycopersici]|uniref:Uncharacterized protein n=1 Tax=Erysiphe neolycopersici TaxID=212602 RepID=A0A420I1U9_9PEZI|nr:hypothetical protein OnM2_c2013o16 [Erysiphe neolycopersici]
MIITFFHLRVILYCGGEEINVVGWNEDGSRSMFLDNWWLARCTHLRYIKSLRGTMNNNGFKK